MSLAPLPSQTWNAPAVVDLPKDWNPEKDGAALLFFSMPTCPWCLRIAGTMETVAKTLGSVVPVLKVGSDHKLVRTYGVSGFPTLIFVDAFGKPTEYKGARTADAISSFVCGNTKTRNAVCSKYF
jgi:thioredoxin-related protein